MSHRRLQDRRHVRSAQEDWCRPRCPTRNEQENALLKYSGSWTYSWTWAASNSSFRYAKGAGVAVTVTFDGTYLAWLAKKGPGYGKAAVSLDGGDTGRCGPVLAPTTSTSRRSTPLVCWRTSRHTLTIYWTGQKNKAAYDSRVNVDRFDVIGELVLELRSRPADLGLRPERQPHRLSGVVEHAHHGQGLWRQPVSHQHGREPESW